MKRNSKEDSNIKKIHMNKSIRRQVHPSLTSLTQASKSMSEVVQVMKITSRFIYMKVKEGKSHKVDQVHNKKSI
jgi:hypothetical protein